MYRMYSTWDWFIRIISKIIPCFLGSILKQTIINLHLKWTHLKTFMRERSFLSASFVKSLYMTFERWSRRPTLGKDILPNCILGLYWFLNIKTAGFLLQKTWNFSLLDFFSRNKHIIHLQEISRESKNITSSGQRLYNIDRV